tara:strand:- start:131 stop:988 length:858 start_codon:yes stop_codon:yes gene_type:complete
MSTLKVDTVEHPTSSSAVDLPNKLKVGGATIEQGYTASGSEPGSANTGDWWWDTGNNKLYRYINGEFKLLGLVTPSQGAGGNWAGDRAVVFNGYNDDSTWHQISYFDITTTGNAADFGDEIYDSQNSKACSNGTRGVVSGGTYTGSKDDYRYITIATTGNAADFGDLLVRRYSQACMSDGTKGVNAGGIGGASNQDLNDIEYITIDTLGNGTDFGDISDARKACEGASDGTYGLIAGGNSTVNTIDYITIANTGNATDFGDMDDGREYFGMTGSSTRVLFGGGDT